MGLKDLLLEHTVARGNCWGTCAPMNSDHITARMTLGITMTLDSISARLPEAQQ
jgi:hypothetical protein